MECDKIAYASQQEALAAAKAMSIENGKSKMLSYKCKECNQFHLATKGKRKRIQMDRTGPIQTKFPMQKPGQLPKSKSRDDGKLKTMGSKLISKAMADHLRRLIEGQNNMYKRNNQ